MFKVSHLMMNVYLPQNVSTGRGIGCVENNLKPQTLNLKPLYVEAVKN